MKQEVGDHDCFLLLHHLVYYSPPTATVVWYFVAEESCVETFPVAVVIECALTFEVGLGWPRRTHHSDVAVEPAAFLLFRVVTNGLRDLCLVPHPECFQSPTCELVDPVERVAVLGFDP